MTLLSKQMPQSTPMTTVTATTVGIGEEGGDVVVQVDADEEVKHGGESCAVSRGRFSLVTYTVRTKPYGFSIKPGTLEVKESKGKAASDGVKEGDELVSVAGITVEPINWREAFKSISCPFPCVFLKENAGVDKGAYTETQSDEPFGIGLATQDFEVLKRDPRVQGLAPLLEILQEGWSSITDAKKVFKKIIKPPQFPLQDTIQATRANPDLKTLALEFFGVPTGGCDPQSGGISESSERVASLVKRIEKLVAVAGLGGAAATMMKDSKGDVGWSPGSSITDLVHKLSDTLSTMQKKADSMMKRVDGAVGGNDGGIEALSKAEGELSNQLKDLGQVFKVLLEMNRAQIGASDSRSSDKGSGAIASLLAESLSALQGRAGQVAAHLKFIGDQVRDQVFALRESRNYVSGDYQDEDEDEDIDGARALRGWQTVQDLGRRGKAILAENRNVVEAGISLLSLAGIMRPGQALVAQKGISLTLDAIDSNGKMIDLIFDGLVKQLPKVPIPDIEGYSQDKAYWFRVANLNLGDLKVSRDNIKPYMSKRRILRIQAIDLSVIMRDVEWAFKQTSWPKLHAKGKADAHANGISLRLILELRKSKTADQTTEWKFHLSSKKVDIGELKLKITKGSISWVANTILWLFSDQVRRYVSQEIENATSYKIEQLITVLNTLVSSTAIRGLLISGKRVKKRIKKGENDSKEGKKSAMEGQNDSKEDEMDSKESEKDTKRAEVDSKEAGKVTKDGKDKKQDSISFSAPNMEENCMAKVKVESKEVLIGTSTASLNPIHPQTKNPSLPFVVSTSKLKLPPKPGIPVKSTSNPPQPSHPVPSLPQSPGLKRPKPPIPSSKPPPLPVNAPPRRPRSRT
ncbi:hypothetical protein AAMO2058_000732800 [Amorphochlora amoebiformis]